QHTLEIVHAVLGHELVDEIRLAGAHRAAGQALVEREHALRGSALVEAPQRVHEIAALLRVLQTHRQVVARHGLAGPVAEGLEEMRGDRRAKKLDQDLAGAGEALRLAHASTGVPAQWVRASSASWTPPGTGSIGPTMVRWRITPSLSIRKRPCSCAVMAWWWRRRRKLRFMTSNHAPRIWLTVSP